MPFLQNLIDLVTLRGPYFEVGDDRESRRIREQLQGGNWRRVEEFFGELQNHREREFYVRGVSNETPSESKCYELWTDRAPESADAWLVRGAFQVKLAWEIRGSDAASTVTKEAWARFEQELERAASFLAKAAELGPDDPAPYWQLLACVRGMGREGDDARNLFKAAIARDPNHYGAHLAMLAYCTKKWHGSHSEMFEFAREAVSRLDEGSPAHAVMTQAHFERYLYASVFDEDSDAEEYWKQPDVVKDCVDAYHRSLGSPQFEENSLALLVRNDIGYGLARTGNYDLALPVLQGIGSRPLEVPWGDRWEFRKYVKKANRATAG